MEGAQPGHAFHRRADQLTHSFPHFARGLVSEGDAQDFARPGKARMNKMRQPVRKCGGLARARAGQHQHRPFGGQHGFALGRVQMGQPIRAVMLLLCVCRA